MVNKREQQSWRRTSLAALAVLSLGLTACNGDDDDGGVTNLDGTTADGSGSGSGSASSSASGSGSASAPASGSGSASGISTDSMAATTDDELIQAAVDGYRVYLEEQVEIMQTTTAEFTQAIRDGDIEKAKELYPVSRRSWERIEPIAGLIEDIDGSVDAREDDFTGPEDAAFTGWHKLEWYLWTQGDVADAGPVADQLEADLQTLADALPTLELPPAVLTVGAQELIEEVAAPDGKLSGEEDRYSGTDLYDFKANVEGSEELVELLTPALEAADPALLETIETQFEQLDEQLEALGSFEAGYPHYDEVTDAQRTEFAATLAQLAESLSQLNGTLGLQ